MLFLALVPERMTVPWSSIILASDSRWRDPTVIHLASFQSYNADTISHSIRRVLVAVEITSKIAVSSSPSCSRKEWYSFTIFLYWLLEARCALIGFAISDESREMEQQRTSQSYEFVDLSSGAGVPVGQDTRLLIRRQAMSRAATARKQRGFWGQHNRRQCPVSQPDPEEPTEVEIDAAASSSV